MIEDIPSIFVVKRYVENWYHENCDKTDAARRRSIDAPDPSSICQEYKLTTVITFGGHQVRAFAREGEPMESLNDMSSCVVLLGFVLASPHGMYPFALHTRTIRSSSPIVRSSAVSAMISTPERNCLHTKRKREQDACHSCRSVSLQEEL